MHDRMVFAVLPSVFAKLAAVGGGGDVAMS